MAHFYQHNRPSYTSVSAPIFAPPTPHRHSHRHSHSVPTSRISVRPHAPTRSHPAADIDPVLAYHGHSQHASIEFDLTLSLSHILVSHGPARSSYSGLSSHDLAYPATSPPLPYLHIRCEELPWSIDVYPALNSDSGVVTVGDVLHGIYRALRHRVSSSEWHASSSSMQHRVRDAWVRRCKRQQSYKERTYESNNGLRRIDWLAKNTLFRGLSPGRASDHWIMHVGQPEKTVKFRVGS